MKKVLILATNPKDTTRLRLDEEVRDIEEGLQRSQKRDQFILKQQLAVRPKDIRRAVLEFKPQIVHFSGHGTEEEELIFENETGKSKLVSGAALADFFKLFADTVECVVLNGCYSAVQAKAIAQHINYVIGMNQAIGDKAAIEFAVGFYDALGAGGTIEFAYNLGCSAIRMAGIEEHLTPVLLKKPEVAASTVEPSSTKKDSLPKKIQKWQNNIPWRNLRTLFKASMGVTFFVLVVRLGGALQSLELAAYDSLMRFQLSSFPAERPDDKFLIIEVNKQDAANEEEKASKSGGKNGTLTDDSLNKLLNKLLENEPLAIGLDFYRNYKSKVPELTNILKNNNSIFAVCKAPIDENDKGIDPPPELINSPERVGFSDILQGEEVILRRQFLSHDPGNSKSKCQSKNSLSLKLARSYLASTQKKGKNQEAFDSNRDLQDLIINGVILQQLKNPDTGGYRGIDDGGYQILLDYRSFCQNNKSNCSPYNVAARKFSLEEVLKKNLLTKEDVNGKIVLIGIADNSYANDYVNTPYTEKSQEGMPGFIVQAQMVSYLLRIALGEQSQLRVLSFGYESLWILAWSLMGGILAQLYKSPRRLIISQGVALASLHVLCLIFFISSSIKIWAPLVPSALTFMGTGGVVVFIRFRIR